MWRTFLVVAALSQPVQAQSAHPVGDWLVEDRGEGTFAAYTVNDSGGAFGKLCVPGSCIWFLTASAQCNDETEYPALASSESGARHVTLSCFGPKKTGQALAFQESAAIQAISDNDSHVGFAFPMASGTFKVFRFSLNGSEKAARIAEAAAQAAAARQPHTSDIDL